MQQEADIAQRRSALKAALLRPRPALDRIPRLGDILDGACESIGEAIASIVPDLRASLMSLDSCRTHDLLGATWETQLCAVVHTKAPANEILIHFSTEAASAFTVRAMGGQGQADAAVWPRSGLSRVEIAMARAIAEAVVPVLTAAFQKAGIKLALEMGAVGSDQSAVAIARDNVPAVVARMKLDALAISPWLSIVMPLSLIATFADKLAGAASGGQAGLPVSGRDTRWSKKVESGLARARVSITAVLETRAESLETLAGLKVGDILELDATAQSGVTIESEDVPLYACELGKSNGMLTVKVDSKFLNGEKAELPQAPSAAATEVAA